MDRERERGRERLTVHNIITHIFIIATINTAKITAILGTRFALETHGTRSGGDGSVVRSIGMLQAALSRPRCTITLAILASESNLLKDSKTKTLLHFHHHVRKSLQCRSCFVLSFTTVFINRANCSLRADRCTLPRSKHH